MKRSHALMLRQMIEKAAVSLDDKDASEAVELFPKMKYDGSLIEYKTRINWNGVVKMAKTNLWDTVENDPGHAPDMWADIKYRDGIRIIPEIITSEEAFALGEKGWWKDVLYVSLIAANVYTPAQYPAGWKELIT